MTATGRPRMCCRCGRMTNRSRATGEVLLGMHAGNVATGDWLIITGLSYIARPATG